MELTYPSERVFFQPLLGSVIMLMLLGEAITRVCIIYLLGSWKLELGSSRIFNVVEKARLVEN